MALVHVATVESDLLTCLYSSLPHIKSDDTKKLGEKCEYNDTKKLAVHTVSRACSFLLYFSNMIQI